MNTPYTTKQRIDVFKFIPAPSISGVIEIGFEIGFEIEFTVVRNYQWNSGWLCRCILRPSEGTGAENRTGFPLQQTNVPL